MGVAPDTCVGLYTEPSADLMIGVWGILSAGAAYLPLSPDYPAARLRYMTENADVRVIVTQPHLRERVLGLAPAGTTVVTTADVSGPTAPRPDTDPDHLAYVIYTSGSTGKPKGVMIEQRGILSQLRWLANCGHLGPGVSILQKTPMSFDAAQWEILAPAVGARVVMGTPGIFRNPEAVITMVCEHRVTALQVVPTLLQALIDTEELGACASLTRLFSGGEALTRPLARDLFAALPDVSLVNLYGPTETTINATSHWVDPGVLADAPAGILPVGVPADSVTCYILDENMQPVDITESGELFIGGAQVARGYIGLPEVTAERFLTSPFNPTERLYRTGDLCQWNPDGTIQFTGRTDNQVKLRGYRVELEEVASRIEEHTWVRRATAVVTDDPRTGGRTLVAAVEMNERTAAVMDQGRDDAAHHQSKTSKLQVRAQLAGAGLRGPEELSGRRTLALPGRDPADEQRRTAFARKTYRFYEGGPVSAGDVYALLAPRPHPLGPARSLATLSLEELGRILRWFGPFHSESRLLPKYAYASPGALYATQMYLEIDGLLGLSGVYYHYPADHTLVRVGDLGEPSAEPSLKVHFLGRRRAIEPVYKNNVLEVLEFEAGHMVGLFEEILPGHQLAIEPVGFDPRVSDRLAAAEDDDYLGTFAIHGGHGRARTDETDLFVQVHGDRIAGLAPGLYRYRDGMLDRIGDRIVERHHVIAINQEVYGRASFGISAVARTSDDWRHHMVLGSLLHRLQRTPGLGLMSSGYSSKSGNPLPAARRLDDLLADAGMPAAPASYFFVDGGTAPHGSRLVPLHAGGGGAPVFCWPGLGGYPMNLRLLAREANLGRPVTGVQAHGINPGEVPYGTIREMAMADVSEIRRVQPSGPYTLWGYSFGARVAFEAAWQLE